MSDRGVALVLVLLVMMTLSALAMSLGVLVSTESRVTANYRDGLEVFYGAEAALVRVLPDLAVEPDPNQVLTGLILSSFNDGPPGLVHGFARADVDAELRPSCLQRRRTR
jgi:Tfp pilus assembly protein PilX